MSALPRTPRTSVVGVFAQPRPCDDRAWSSRSSARRPLFVETLSAAAAAEAESEAARASAQTLLGRARPRAQPVRRAHGSEAASCGVDRGASRGGDGAVEREHEGRRSGGHRAGRERAVRGHGRRFRTRAFEGGGQRGGGGSGARFRGDARPGVRSARRAHDARRRRTTEVLGEPAASAWPAVLRRARGRGVRRFDEPGRTGRSFRGRTGRRGAGPGVAAAASRSSDTTFAFSARRSNVARHAPDARAVLKRCSPLAGRYLLGKAVSKDAVEAMDRVLGAPAADEGAGRGRRPVALGRRRPACSMTAQTRSTRRTPTWARRQLRGVSRRRRRMSAPSTHAAGRCAGKVGDAVKARDLLQSREIGVAPQYGPDHDQGAGGRTGITMAMRAGSSACRTLTRPHRLEQRGVSCGTPPTTRSVRTSTVTCQALTARGSRRPSFMDRASTSSPSPNPERGSARRATRRRVSVCVGRVGR